MKVKVFMNSTMRDHERDVLRAMYSGIEKELLPASRLELKLLRDFNKSIGRGLGLEYSYDEKWTKCDVAVMFGSWKPERKNLHHLVRTSIANSEKPFVMFETPLLGRRVFQPNKHYRVGVNGFLNKSAFWGEDKEYPDDRFLNLGLKYNGWKKDRGNKIVVAMQLAGDASMRNMNINDWCMNTIDKIRAVSNRPIEIRTHPGVSDKGIDDYNELYRRFAFSGYKDITFVNGRNIPWEDQILDAHCVVAYTSGLSIDAVLNGIPVIACDEGNFAWGISSRDVKHVDDPFIADEKDVQLWLNRLAYSQWNLEEIENGTVWKHLKPGIEKILDEINDIGDIVS